MVYRCPQCGKVIELSDDELVSQGNLIVCPACLAEFAGRPDLPTAQTEEVKTYNYGAHSTPAQMPSATEEYVYCRYCGTQLPKGGKFCSNCGKPLAAPVHRQAEPSYAVPAVPQQPIPPANQMPYMPSYRYASSSANGPVKRKKAPVLAYFIMIALIAIFILIVTSI